MRREPQRRAWHANAAQHRIVDGLEIVARLELLPFEHLGNARHRNQRNRAALWCRGAGACSFLGAHSWIAGWRNGSAKWPVYYPDSVPPVLDMGLGSPTGVTVKIGPNEACTCGSGRKYKKCCKPGKPG